MSRQEPENLRLAAIDEWVNCHSVLYVVQPAKRETNTMPQWAGSSWYFLRYVDNHNDKELVSKEKADEYASGRYVYRRCRACCSSSAVFQILYKIPVRYRSHRF